MIVLVTDFGLAGPYTGQMQAVLQQNAPGVPVVTLFADAPAGRPKPSAYLLSAYSAWFPAHTIFLCVVDPGVGGTRAPLVLEADDRIFVGPDNGLFELVCRRASSVLVSEITWRPVAMSVSFHGRDLFAPVAAKLARGTRLGLLASPAKPLRFPEWPEDLPEIVYIDHYGNAMTGLRSGSVAPDAVLVAGGHRIPPAAVFSSVPEGCAFWYVNSNGLIEVAVNRGRADRALSLEIGSRVAIG